MLDILRRDLKSVLLFVWVISVNLGADGRSGIHKKANKQTNKWWNEQSNGIHQAYDRLAITVQCISFIWWVYRFFLFSWKLHYIVVVIFAFFCLTISNFGNCIILLPTLAQWIRTKCDARFSQCLIHIIIYSIDLDQHFHQMTSIPEMSGKIERE